MNVVANVCITPAKRRFDEKRDVSRKKEKGREEKNAQTCDAVEAAHDGKLVPRNRTLFRRDLFAPNDHGNDVQKAERERQSQSPATEQCQRGDVKPRLTERQRDRERERDT
jgi:hypothetical protein